MQDGCFHSVKNHGSVAWLLRKQEACRWLSEADVIVCLQDGILVGAVGAYDWNGAVLKETRHGKVVPPKSSYAQEFPEELKNHGAYLGKGFSLL